MRGDEGARRRQARTRPSNAPSKGMGHHRQGATTSKPPLPHLLDIAGIADHLGVTERHVRRLIAERRIPYLRWGHRIRFDPDDVARWLEAARVPPLRESGLLCDKHRPSLAASRRGRIGGR